MWWIALAKVVLLVTYSWYHIDAYKRPAFYFRERVFNWQYIKDLWCYNQVFTQKMDFWGQKVVLFKFAKKGALIRTGQVVAVAFYMRRYGIYIWYKSNTHWFVYVPKSDILGSYMYPQIFFAKKQKSNRTVKKPFY